MTKSFSFRLRLPKRGENSTTTKRNKETGFERIEGVKRISNTQCFCIPNFSILLLIHLFDRYVFFSFSATVHLVFVRSPCTVVAAVVENDHSSLFFVRFPFTAVMVVVS